MEDSLFSSILQQKIEESKRIILKQILDREYEPAENWSEGIYK